MSPIPQDILDKAKDAAASHLGDTYDCTRCWTGWQYGTMTQDDFVPIREDDDRIHELTVGILNASGLPDLAAENARMREAVVGLESILGKTHRRLTKLADATRMLLLLVENETGLPDQAANGVTDSSGMDEGCVRAVDSGRCTLRPCSGDARRRP